MSRTKYLVKNIGLLSISALGTKLIAFFLVPLYTSILTTSDYGILDLINTSTSLLLPILTLGISSAVMRYAMEADCDRKSVFSYGIKLCFISSLIVLLLLILNYIFSFNAVIKQNTIFVFFMFFITTLTNILPQFARGIENVKAIAISGILYSFSVAVLNIYFLVVLKLGIKGYLLAYIIGGIIQIFFLFVDSKMWRYISIGRIDKNLKNKMLSYSMPLIANDISWWITSASDRYVVTGLCGVEANGIYSVAYKIPSALAIVENVINKAWGISAVKDFNSEDSTDYFSKMYSLYNFLLCAFCSVLIISARFLARILFAKDFYEAWHYVPFLSISVIFGALSGFIGGLFGAAKDTKLYAYSTMVGAAMNIVLNIILVKEFNSMGAAVSTLFSYICIWGIRLFSVKKYIKLNINIIKDIICYCLLIIQSIILLKNNANQVKVYLMEIILFLLIIILNIKIIKQLFKHLRRYK